MTDDAPRRLRVSPLGVLSALLGLALLAWTIRQTGTAPIAEGIRRVGWGILAILVLGGLRFAVRAWAWALCCDSEPPLTARATFPAMVTGDALGNLTPLGLFVSEPVKAAFVRHRVSLMSALSSIGVENLLYTLTVALVIAAGTVALVFLFDTPRALQTTSLVLLGLMFVVIAAGLAVMGRQVRLVSGALAWLDRLGLGHAALRGRLEKLRMLEDNVLGFYARGPSRTLGILGVETLFHVLGVIEVYVMLVLLTGPDRPSLLATFVLEAVNRAVTVVFKFVPLRLGVDEAGTELLTRTLGLPGGIGVTMALVRKVRMLFWTGAGVGFLVRRGLRPPA